MYEDQKDTAQCAREKYWRELSIEEKIERMRMIVKQRDYHIEQLETAITKLQREFPTHKHADGQVTIALTGNEPWGQHNYTTGCVTPRGLYGGGQIGRDDTEVYF